MNLKKCNQLLQEYKNQLNVISVNDADYKISLGIAVSNFFNEIKKLDKNFFEHYLNNFNEENITKNKVQKDALHYLILLIIKNTNNAEFFTKFFPDYLELELPARSNWRVMRWLQIFVSWIIKPKPKLSNLTESRIILNYLRDIKQRIENTKNDLLDATLEMEFYKALPFIVEKFLENKAPPLIYMPINEFPLTDWILPYMQKIYIDRQSNEINHFTYDFKQVLNLRMDKIQFYYAAFRQNLDRQAEFCYGNISDFYEALNKLEAIFYTNKNLFFYTANQVFSSADYTNLSGALNGLQMLAKELESYARKMDPKSLESDLCKLSQFILAEVLFLKNELEKEIEEYNERYENYSDEGWDTDWDDDLSDTSETPNRDYVAQEEEVLITNADTQSDSGISDEESNQQIIPKTSSSFWQASRHCEREARDNPTGWPRSLHSLAMTG